jgi:predicted nucleotidyltransferase component of viral defense system
MTDAGLVQSVRTRLLTESKRTGADPNVVLSRYGLERFLYRLSASRYRDRFLLKGAMMMVVWIGASARATRDADLLGLGEMSTDELRAIFEDVCKVNVENDGMSFDETSIAIETIREADPDGGRRVRIRGNLGRARVPVQIDVGLGDAVSPPPEETEVPTLLAGLPAPVLRAYRPETSIAEKLQAMIERGETNSRMKDFFDVAELARLRSFDGKRLAKAIGSTLAKRATAIPGGGPVALRDSFAAMPDKQLQWKAFVRRAGLDDGSMDFALVVARVRSFLGPVLEAIGSKQKFDARWSPGGPWMADDRTRERK